MISRAASIHCVVLRGGTTRGFFFRAEDLPRQSAARDQLLLSIIAGAEAWQSDGLGGADYLLSKAAIILPPTRPGVHVDVVYGVVTTGSRRIKYGSNCGNLSAAVGLYAIAQGLVADPNATVRMFNPDSGSIVEARAVPWQAWQDSSAGPFGGVPRTGTLVELAFVRPGGTIGRGVLPTGRAVDRVHAEDGRTIEVSIVDSGTVYVFVDSKEAGLQAATGALTARHQIELLRIASRIRARVAVMLGLATAEETADRDSPNVPKVAFVSAPPGPNIDLLARIVSSQSLHGAYAVTGAIATASAAVIEGSVVARLVQRPRTALFTLRIGHPHGIIEPSINWQLDGSEVVIDRAYILRTARTLMSGFVYVPDIAGAPLEAAPVAVAPADAHALG